MKITRFDVRTVLVPAEPHRVGSAVVTASPLVLLTVHTDAGVAGNSMLFTKTPAGPKPARTRCATARRWSRARSSRRRRSRRAERAVPLLGTQGPVGIALEGIDMALWDARAAGSCRCTCYWAASRGRCAAPRP